jgi:hypothetical protein
LWDLVAGHSSLKIAGSFGEEAEAPDATRQAKETQPASVFLEQATGLCRTIPANRITLLSGVAR